MEKKKSNSLFIHRQPGLDISESELPLVRCDQVIGIDGLKIDDPLDIGIRSPAHLQLNFNNANLFEDGADPSSLVTSIGWDAVINTLLYEMQYIEPRLLLYIFIYKYMNLYVNIYIYI